MKSARGGFAAVFGTAALLALSLPATATNLVQNGSFSSTSAGGNGGPVNSQGQIGYNINVGSWTLANTSPSASYFFLLNCPGCDTQISGAPSGDIGTEGIDGYFGLWGPGDGSSNSLENSPDGGNFVGSDPLYQNTALEQTINGLTPGGSYVVSFYWAAAQQYGHTGDISNLGWIVSLGSQTLDTSTVNLASEGFSGWKQATLNFTATGTSELLSFLSTGSGAAALPPFVLLDGVSLTSASPEPLSWVLMLSGFGMVCGLRAGHRRKKAIKCNSN